MVTEQKENVRVQANAAFVGARWGLLIGKHSFSRSKRRSHLKVMPEAAGTLRVAETGRDPRWASQPAGSPEAA